MQQISFEDPIFVPEVVGGFKDAYLPILFGMIPTTKIENHQPDYVFFPEWTPSVCWLTPVWLS